MKSELEKRISKLEKLYRTPGTIIMRSLLDDNKGRIGWVVAFGEMGLPKTMGYGTTINNALARVEEKLFSTKG